MLRKPQFPLILLVFLFLGLISVLTGCNLPGTTMLQTDLDVTQAYQTIQAKLTFAVGQTPVGTISPSEQVFISTGTVPVQTDIMPTQTIISTGNETITTNPQVTPNSCDIAAAGYPKIDISIEDDTEMSPGEEFEKIWRVENVGSCTWTTAYHVVFFSGEIMGASPSQPLEDAVPPNSSIDITVNMVAPSQSGTYQGNWKLRNDKGIMFGIGPNGESPFWVRIKVVSEVTETPSPTPSLTPTAVVQASGSASLALDDTIDLDTLLVNSGGPDLRYRTTLIDPRHQLVPVIGVKVNIFGSTQPTFSDCQSANLTTAPIILDDLPVGTYFCHSTDLSLPGWFRFDGIDLDTEVITLQVLTWKMP